MKIIFHLSPLARPPDSGLDFIQFAGPRVQPLAGGGGARGQALGELRLRRPAQSIRREFNLIQLN